MLEKLDKSLEVAIIATEEVFKTYELMCLDMLKEIGRKSREGIQELLDKKVYLDLWVKVSKNWRKDEAALSRFGYK